MYFITKEGKKELLEFIISQAPTGTDIDATLQGAVEAIEFNMNQIGQPKAYILAANLEDDPYTLKPEHVGYDKTVV